MFAILISHENMPLILLESENQPKTQKHLASYLSSKPDWYLVRGYVDPQGRFSDQTVLPAYILKWNFEFDEKKIQKTWDQIVRKTQ